MDKKIWYTSIALAGIAIGLVFAALATAADERPAAPVAKVLDGNTAISIEPLVADERLVLTVSGPGDLRYRKIFEAGSTPVFNLFDKTGKLNPDGNYAWELRSAAIKGARVRGTDAPAIAKRSSPMASGYFAIAEGRFVSPDGVEEIPVKDIVHLDDVIIDGSLCVGNDCYQDYDFGYDTIVLRENNLRIYFEDTSTIAGYPTNDWRITVNDSTSGGAARFSIEDVDETSTPFTIEAGTPDHALYVEDMGRVGLGTSTPYVEVHVVDGDSPTLRLEQDGSFGFTPQTWDITSNETNFFIRDATGGSRLPFRIQPGAPTSSLTIRDSGNVGVGTWSPTYPLQVERTTGTAATLLALKNNGATKFELINTADDTWTFNSAANGLRINANGVATTLLLLETDGDLTIEGDITSNGTTHVPDYVFEPDYPLMSLAELERFVAERKHLPNVPSAAEIEREGGVNLGQMQMRMLEKIEELTLYTLELKQTISKLEARLMSLEGDAGAEP